MHDFDYDVLEKKRIARSARNKINGSKTKYVSLPSDSLTAAEKRKLNGVCEVYKMDRVIPWDEFKKLPRDIQIKYLEFLRDRFHISPGFVGRAFGVNGPYFGKWLKEKDLTGILPIQAKNEAIRAFEEWVSGGTKETPVVEEKPAPVEKPKPKKPEMAYFAHVLKKGEFSLEGSGVEISQTLFGIFRDKNIRMHVTFEEVPVVVVEEETVESEEEEVG